MSEPTKKLSKQDPDFYRTIGQRGGAQTKKIQTKKNPNYYSEIGHEGGIKLLRTRGKKYFAKIGRIGKSHENSSAPK